MIFSKRIEFYEKYGDYVVRFTEYYKYIFRFETLEGCDLKIKIAVGGGPDDIYRFVCTRDGLYKISDLDLICYGHVKNGDDVVFDSFI